MSSPLAIAGVTRLLMDLLNNGVIEGDISSVVGNVAVSALPPDKVTEAGSEPTQLNLFMYHTSPNTGWNNSGLPSFNSNGDRVGNPPLALDLHYMLSAFTSADFHSEILLGYAMQLLHDHPVLTREEIRNALIGVSVGGNGLTPELQALQTVGLDEQVESIKITPEYLNLEELSKLWAAFQTNYRPSAFYKVTVVLIESYKSTRVPLPVTERNLVAFPFSKPTITGISSRASSADPFQKNQKILSGHDIAVEGMDLKGESVMVRIDNIEVLPEQGNISPSRISFTLPTGLVPGVHGVQVVHNRLIGSPPEPRGSTQSNIEAFVLSPEITNVNETNITVTDATRSADLSIQVDPAVSETQTVIVILNSTSADASYSFLVDIPPQSPPGPVSNFDITIERVLPGNYLVRIQVDGAESPLVKDANNNFSSPSVAILP
jgi:hypothetical protein